MVLIEMDVIAGCKARDFIADLRRLEEPQPCLSYFILFEGKRVLRCRSVERS